MEVNSEKPPNEEFKLLSKEEYEALSEEEKKKHSEEVGEHLLETLDRFSNRLTDLYNFLNELSESDLNEND